MDFTTLTIDVLKMLSIAGSYGVGIILLTVIVRALMWPRTFAAALNENNADASAKDESYSGKIQKQSSNDAAKNDGVL